MVEEYKMHRSHDSDSKEIPTQVVKVCVQVGEVEVHPTAPRAHIVRKWLD